MEIDNDKFTWNIINNYFKDNKNLLIRHHLDSFNNFYNKNIFNIIKEKNPIKILKEQDPDTKKYKYEANIYIGGIEGDKLYFGKPIIFDESREHYMFPNEARLRNMTYGTTLHVDVDVVYKIRHAEKEVKDEDKKGVKEEEKKDKSYEDEEDKEDDEDNIEIIKTRLESIYFGKFPIMLNSDLCILNNMDSLAKFNMGECKNDYGGYFIIDGKEKLIVPQEKFADNMLYIRDEHSELYSHSADIRSVSEDASKPVRTLSIRILRPSLKYTNNQIVVNVPNVRKPVPLFILMRALGVLSDKDIIKFCLLDIEKYEHYMDLFKPCIHDAGYIFNQETAIKYIATLTKGKTIAHVLEILMDYLLPHIGENNFIDKAYYLGYMVHELLKVVNKDAKPTDRDSFKFKRIETTGSLLYDLFKEYYSLQQKHIFQTIDKEYYYKSAIYQDNFTDLIENNYRDIFKDRILESGFKKAFKGSWGSEEHTKRPEVIQDLNRLSYNSFISHLRKLNLPLDSSAKVIGPRLLHSSQWGIIDPLDTPDGGNVGLHKHLALGAHITAGFSSKKIIEFLKNTIFIELLSECRPEYISQCIKVFVNGAWVGIINEPIYAKQLLLSYRRLGLLPIYTSINWSISENILYINTDAGRLCRPVFYVEDSMPSYLNKEILSKILNNDFNFYQLLLGINEFKDDIIKIDDVNNYINYINKNNVVSNFNKLYKNINKKEKEVKEKEKEKDKKQLKEDKKELKEDLEDDLEEVTDKKEIKIKLKEETELDLSDKDKDREDILKKLLKNGGIIDYIDSSESESSLIVNYSEDITKYTTHLEIHPSLTLGVMGNQIVFPENNQLPRNLFSCGQSKQGASLYNSNFQNRIDKMGIVLNNLQLPLIKSRYLKHIYNEEHGYGVNVIVAIGCYGGYNVEDSILFNEGSIKRGMFNTTYFNMYESREETSKIGKNTTDSRFACIEKENVIGKKPGYDYSNLNDSGLINENTQLDDKKVIIGKITNNLNNPNNYIDSSITPKKGQLGFVDKSFITDGEEGMRIAKVRIREERIPAIGDKFCSRCGQKGTVGLIIPEKNMPFTDNGIRPDIIINPHALPSRMTIGQLVETLMGKTCSIYGGFGDCTAFVNKGSKQELFGKMLKNVGYNSSGNELLYNGETGEQIEMEMFIGPCYYMRLKHMVKDKINYRAQGPRTALTRQTVQGRANDGGLRIGEMERDSLISHGVTKFINESMLKRGDEYYVAICNTTGTIAIYNESKDIFISPYADGPIKFNENTDSHNIEVITKYGRSFSIIRVPYCFKLLLHELQVMNIQMRIITEDNIAQLTNFNMEHTLKSIRNNILNIDQKEEFDKLYNKQFNIDDTEDLNQEQQSEVRQGITKTQKTLNETDEPDESETEDLEDTDESGEKDKTIEDKEKDDDDEKNDDDDDDESGLSQVTIDSIRRAEKEAESYVDDDNSDESEEDEKPPLTIGSKIVNTGKSIVDSIINTGNSIVGTNKEEQKPENESILKPKEEKPKEEIVSNESNLNTNTNTNINTNINTNTNSPLKTIKIN